jgi:cleavage and polyadenylation specificity factor subunit 1
VKGAVTALCACSGHLVSTTGPKVIIYSFEDNESLVGVAFIDVQTYVTSMVAIKNFILLGDAQKSIWFLGYQVSETRICVFETKCQPLLTEMTLKRWSQQSW